MLYRLFLSSLGLILYKLCSSLALQLSDLHLIWLEIITRTGAKKRAFHAEDPPMIPAFKWSHDDKFFARMSKVNIKKTLILSPITYLGRKIINFMDQSI